MVRGESLTSVHGADASEDLVRLIEHFPLLYHVGEKMPFERLEPDLKDSWDELMSLIHEKRPDVREDLVWKAWRTIRGEYYRERCPQRWKGKLDFLGAAEIPNRQSTRSNYEHAKAALRRYNERMGNGYGSEDDSSSLNHASSSSFTPRHRPARRGQKRPVFSPEPAHRHQAVVRSAPRIQGPVAEKRPRMSLPYPVPQHRNVKVLDEDIQVLEHVRPNILQPRQLDDTVEEVSYRQNRYSASTPARSSQYGYDDYMEEEPVYEEQPRKCDETFRACLLETWQKIQKKNFSESFLSTMKRRVLKIIDDLHNEA